MNPEFRAALRGNLAEYMRDRTAAIAKGVESGTRAGGVLGKRRFRMDMRRAGLGGKLEKSWQVRNYPASGNLNPAALIFSKAPHVVRGFTAGAIRSAGAGAWLAIPTEFTPTAMARANRTMWLEEYNRINPGDLQPIEGPRNTNGRTIYMVSKKEYPRPGARKGELGRLMYTLVRQVRFKRRLNTDQIMRGMEFAFPRLLARHLAKELRDG